MAAQKVSVVKVHNVLMVTVPPEPDDETISQLQEQVLVAMDRYQAKGLVLDISAVDTLDSYFARTIAETAGMVSLMGGQTVITGMRPSVTITAVQFGLTLGNVMTALNSDRALDMLENQNSLGRQRDE